MIIQKMPTNFNPFREGLCTNYVPKVGPMQASPLANLLFLARPYPPNDRLSNINTRLPRLDLSSLCLTLNLVLHLIGCTFLFNLAYIKFE